MRNILIAVSIAVFYLVFATIVDADHTWVLFATLSFTFVLGYIIFNKNGVRANLKKFAIFVLPICLLFLITVIFQDNSFVRGIPYIIFIPFVAFAAILVKQKESIWLLLLAIPIFAIIGLVGFPNWFSYYQNRNSHVDEFFPKLKLVNEKNVGITLSDNKILVLDLWSTNCGVCLKKFPGFENIYSKYRENPDIDFYAVNIPIGTKHDFQETKEFFESLNYNFKTLYSIEHDSIVSKKIGFHGYPQLIIVKEGKIRYIGSLISENHIFVHNIEKEIKRLLK